ncbi:hypothetical protein [Rarobacter incanus]|uniref:SatD family protein n=1 Tax=Rarobacter incanus TaxID=153494 RepID=A0A542SLV2_9MICO|nr:hypothetical protein [Rarobacter incanus]TQK75614.1 hypothetical protein FB389_0244 [Rarobacter incanus]
MFVLTIDQDRSRASVDRVPELVEQLAALAGAKGQRAVGADPGACKSRMIDGWLLPPERTVGDELQAVTPSPRIVVDAVRLALRSGHWQIGIGIGAIEETGAGTSREARGPAFLAARKAVERARGRRIPQPVAVESATDPSGASVADTEALFQFVAAMYGLRSTRGWELIDRAAGDPISVPRSEDAPGPTMAQPRGSKVAPSIGWVDARTADISVSDMARDLGVSRQAVSQQLRRAFWQEEIAIVPLLERLVQRAHNVSGPGDRGAENAGDTTAPADRGTEHAADAAESLDRGAAQGVRK